MLEAIEYEDGSTASINDDNSVTIRESDGTSYTVTGFPTSDEAHDFRLCGDFEEIENSFLESINEKYTLTWVYHD